MPELILRREDGTVVCERLTLADSPVTRLRGLLGRDGLEQGEGLIFTTRERPVAGSRGRAR